MVKTMSPNSRLKNKISMSANKKQEIINILSSNEDNTSSQASSSSSDDSTSLDESSENVVTNLEKRKRYKTSHNFGENNQKVNLVCFMSNEITKIPKWIDDETFINKSKCNIPKHLSCSVCMNLMFSKSIRGIPIGHVDWFNDQLADHVTSDRYKNNNIVRNKLFSMLRSHELQLRDISRKKVLDDLLLRFRGYYTKDNPDIIDVILNDYKFTTIKSWCSWKSALDSHYLAEYNNLRNNNILYCSGCGEKAYRFMAHNSTEYYQR